MTVPPNPYEAPASREANPQSRMDWWSAITIRSAVLVTACYSPMLLVYRCWGLAGPYLIPGAIVLLILDGAVLTLNIAAMIFTIRDWRRRSFENSAVKYLWLFVIVMTGGAGWLCYILKFRIWHHEPQPLS